MVEEIEYLKPHDRTGDICETCKFKNCCTLDDGSDLEYDCEGKLYLCPEYKEK